MERRDFEDRPDDLERVGDWLRAQRPEVSALELDRIKQRARAQAMRGERRGAGAARPRRALSTAITVVALTVSLGGAFAIAGKAPPSSPPKSGSSKPAQPAPSTSPARAAATRTISTSARTSARSRLSRRSAQRLVKRRAS